MSLLAMFVGVSFYTQLIRRFVLAGESIVRMHLNVPVNSDVLLITIATAVVILNEELNQTTSSTDCFSSPSLLCVAAVRHVSSVYRVHVNYVDALLYDTIPVFYICIVSP